MPTYDYKCSNCGHKIEILQKITDSPLKTCPACHNDNLHRGPGGGIGIALTGDGFYKTMYGQGSGSNAAGGEKTSSTNSEPTKDVGCCPCGKGKGACTSS